MADLNTGLSAPEVLEAFDRALHDYTNSQIDTMLAAKQTTLTFDSIPTDGSTNPVRSDGIYDFVNSSVATNTANFIGTFNSVAELEAYSGTVTNNDYAFVISTDSAGNTLYNRYKYNAATQVWSFEYAVNNTAFTAAQWAAIQSGMTASDKTKLDGIEQGANKTVIDASPTSGSSNAVSSGGVHTALSGKQDTIADLSDIRSGASAGATAVQPSALSDYQTKLSGTNKLDPSFIDYDASHRAVSDTEKSTWNGKQDAISDLSTIRSGAAAGATALQQSDVTSTYSASGTTPVNGTAVNAAIGTLDVTSVGGSGKYISAIYETNGKIEATPTTFDTSLSISSTNNNAPTSKAVYDDQERQETEIGAVVNRGAKNLLKVSVPDAKANAGNTGFTWSENTASKNHVSFEIKDDLTIYVKSDTGYTASDVTSFYLTDGSCAYPNTVLNGCPNGGSNTTYELRTATPVKSDYGSGVEITSDSATNVVIIIRSGWSGELTFKPMIRPASITDSTFQPYALPNHELTVENDSQQSEINYAVNVGAKNLLDYTFSINGNTSARTSHDVTFTINADRSISTSGTATANVTAAWIQTNYVVPSDPVILSGCPAGGADNKYRIDILDGTPTGAVVAFDYGNGVVIKSSMFTNGIGLIRIRIEKGQNVNGLVFKPMIRPASITDPTYKPYALPNPVLTPALIEQIDEGAKNIADFTSATKTTYTTATFHGVTITRNGDIFTVSGTSDTNNNAFFNIYYEGATTTKIIPPGNWVALIEDYTGSVVKDIAIQIAAPAVPPDTPYGTPIKFSLSGSESGNWLRVNLRPSTTYNGSFRLMICSQEDYAISTAFVPYALPNPTLTPAAIKAVDEGAKNLLDCSLQSIKAVTQNPAYGFSWNGNVCTSTRGASFTINADNSITVAATNMQNDVWFKLTDFIYSAGSYVISGCPTNDSTSSYYIESDALNYRDIGNGVSFTINSTTTDSIYIIVKAGQTFEKTFYPMICTAQDWAVSQKFVPYAPTNRELYEMIKSLQNA